ncbi:unnamed protein product [Leptidea sinapis]|uniref:Uncharacterized protein n=1 Tax=Leptidea sinapis TaxID=189913 RepID=A0A5E4R248_9NEOP|nr:unnamed protein product [Leptidea sinapis]
MKIALIFVITLVYCFCAVYCKDLILGTSYNNRIIFQEKAEYNAIPLKKRVKEIFYSNPDQHIIKLKPCRT